VFPPVASAERSVRLFDDFCPNVINVGYVHPVVHIEQSITKLAVTGFQPDSMVAVDKVVRDTSLTACFGLDELSQDLIFLLNISGSNEGPDVIVGSLLFWSKFFCVNHAGCQIEGSHHKARLSIRFTEIVLFAHLVHHLSKLYWGIGKLARVAVGEVNGVTAASIFDK
jgi:hypothetical protein